MNAFGQNLRYCLRALRKRPGYTLIIVITLALGVGANIDGFYLFNRKSLRDALRAVPIKRFDAQNHGALDAGFVILPASRSSGNELAAS
jgi:hypothetical protein